MQSSIPSPDLLEAFPCLILLRAYTKMFAVPGVRFGWCMTADRTVIDGLYRAGQPWNVSVIAQACAEAAAKQNGWREQTARRIAEERSVSHRTVCARAASGSIRVRRTFCFFTLRTNRTR